MTFRLVLFSQVRQYKAMQEQMSKRVAELESQNRGLREVMLEKDEQIARLQSEQEALRKAREAESLDYQRKAEDMQLQFSQMLRDALDKVRQFSFRRFANQVAISHLTLYGAQMHERLALKMTA